MYIEILCGTFHPVLINHPVPLDLSTFIFELFFIR